MPQLKDLKLDKVAFKKKDYTPWDISPSNKNTDDKKDSSQQEEKVSIKKAETIKVETSQNIEQEEKIDLGTKEVQTEYTRGTKEVQTGYKERTKEVQTRYKQGTERVHKHDQQGTNSGTDFSLSKITGVQKKVLFLMVELSKSSRSKTTKPLSIEYISSLIKSNNNTVKISIKRLEAKNLLKRIDFKAGRNGWTIYELPDFVYSEVIKDEGFTKLSTEKGTTTPLSSSSNITTTELPPEWVNINFDGLSEYGFNKSHVLQVSKLDVISPDDLQQSIDYFIFDLLENNKSSEIKKSPVAFFMGILRGKGLYTAPPNYESLKDRVLRLKTEQLKQRQEKREKMEAELIQTEFKIWESGITVEEKEKLMPEEVKNSRFSAEKEGFFRTYFKEKFWPSIQQEKYADCF